MPRKGDRVGRFTIMRRSAGQSYYRFRLRHDDGREAVALTAFAIKDPRSIWDSLVNTSDELEREPQPSTSI